jgi:hypothetical protein
MRDVYSIPRPAFVAAHKHERHDHERHQDRNNDWHRCLSSINENTVGATG